MHLGDGHGLQWGHTPQTCSPAHTAAWTVDITVASGDGKTNHGDHHSLRQQHGSQAPMWSPAAAGTAEVFPGGLPQKMNHSSFQISCCSESGGSCGWAGDRGQSHRTHHIASSSQQGCAPLSSPAVLPSLQFCLSVPPSSPHLHSHSSIKVALQTAACCFFVCLFLAQAVLHADTYL